MVGPVGPVGLGRPIACHVPQLCGLSCVCFSEVYNTQGRKLISTQLTSLVHCSNCGTVADLYTVLSAKHCGEPSVCLAAE